MIYRNTTHPDDEGLPDEECQTCECVVPLPQAGESEEVEKVEKEKVMKVFYNERESLGGE